MHVKEEATLMRESGTGCASWFSAWSKTHLKTRCRERICHVVPA
jgi:hypothetical protein